MGKLLAAWGFTNRMVTMSIAALVTFGLLLAMMVVAVPYGVRVPGPTFDALGVSNDVPLIEIEGAETYETSGELLLTTVVTYGSSAFPVDAGSVVRGWLSPSEMVAPIEVFYDPDTSQDTRDAESTQQMITSQENARVAALTELGYDVPATLTILGAAAGSGSDGVVQEGDVITGIRGDAADGSDDLVDVVTFANLSDVLVATPPGSTVTLVVDRDGTSTELPITTGDDGHGGSVLGVYLGGDFDFPVDVEIQLDNVGGPSAGTMFALGIIDMMTPGEMTGGHVVAGTGTISLGGQVGAIGGIRQKMAGALGDGAEYFLAPVANCDEVVGNVPGDLQVISVATLEEARTAVEAIAAGTAADLPTC